MVCTINIVHVPFGMSPSKACPQQNKWDHVLWHLSKATKLFLVTCVHYNYKWVTNIVIDFQISLSEMTCKMPYKPQHPIGLHPWVFHYQRWLKGTLFPRALNNSSVHHKILSLSTRNIRSYWFGNNQYWWYQLKRKRGNDRGIYGKNLKSSYKN